MSPTLNLSRDELIILKEGWYELLATYDLDDTYYEEVCDNIQMKINKLSRKWLK